jgi:glucose/arabinose dehydrogenase
MRPPLLPLLLPGLLLPLLAATPAAARDVVKLYEEMCSACHGNEMQGGLAPGLISGNWKRGGDDESLARAIRDGNSLDGMPPYKDDLSEAEIRAMVVFIREKGEAARRKGITLPRINENEVVRSQEHAFRVKTVVDGLATPWSIAFLPGDRMLVTELRGTLREVEGGKLRTEPVAGTPAVRFAGQGGLMAVAPHPGYATNGWVYLAYTDRATNGAATNAGLTVVVRGRIRDHRWVDEQTIFRAPARFYTPGNLHFGTRLVFDGKGHLFFPIGERGIKEDAQDLAKPNGKVHRVRDDGTVPADNPFVAVSNAFPTIWSYGNRNAQGLALRPGTQELWETEHGPRGGDELNLIRRGANYGWPVITHGMDYNGRPISALTAQEGMEQPALHWTPSIAVCALAFCEGDRFPHWRGNALVTALAQQEVRRVVLAGDRVVSQELLVHGIGRVREVAVGPDGLIYLALNQPDRIVRLEPAE